MANNRMFLEYTPTGERFYLGKRMGSGWYHGFNDIGHKKLNAFFDRCEDWAFANDPSLMDNFRLTMEGDINEPRT